MKTLPIKQLMLITVFLFVSFNFFSQTFWSEDFGMSNVRGDKGTVASDHTGANGQWTLSYETDNGMYANQWFISAMESGRTIGSCNKSFYTLNNAENNTLHIAKMKVRGTNIEENGMGDIGAFYNVSSKSLTDVMAQSPVINCTNKESIRLSFDYFCGAKPGAGLLVYYYDGAQWEMLDKLGMTKAGTCDASKKMKWMKSDIYTLPGAINNNPNFKIGFKWVNDTVTESDADLDALNPSLVGMFFSAAIDNITVSGSAYVAPNNNVNRIANTNRIEIKTVADENNKATIIFTTFSEKFPANNLIIESSIDGVNFTELTQIKSKATEGKIVKIEYSFTDVKATEDLKYYRVKQFNADKRVITSPVVTFTLNAQRKANTNKIDIKAVADKKNNPNIVFTTYSEKFPANDLVIESSTDGTDFIELSKIKSKAVKGNITKIEYNFTDAQANDGVNYYRIKQVNADKTIVMSEVVSFDFIKAKNITFTVYPNPNSGQFTVDFSGIENNHEVQIVLNDMNDGHEIYSTTFYSNSIDSNKMDVNPPTKIAPGRYICSLIFEGIRSSVIVMIN